MIGSFFSKSESEAPVSFCTSSLKLEVSACTKVVGDANSAFSRGLEGTDPDAAPAQVWFRSCTARVGDKRVVDDAQPATLVVVVVVTAAVAAEEAALDPPSFRLLATSSTDDEAESLPLVSLDDGV